MITVNQVQLVPSWDTLTAAEILNYLSTPLGVRKPVSQSRISYDGLMDRFEVAQVAAFRAVLTSEEVGLSVVSDQLAGGGIDFGNPKTQQSLDSLGAAVPGVFTPEVVVALQALGVDNRTPWQRMSGWTAESEGGEPALPTLAEIEQAKNLSVLQRHLDAIRDVNDQAIVDAKIVEIAAVVSDLQEGA